MSDAEAVQADITRKIRQPEGGADDHRPSIEELKRIQRASLIASQVTDIVLGEVSKQSGLHATVKSESNETSDNAVEDSSRKEASGIVLTLFGNAPTPKQLFSSLQVDKQTEQLSTIKSELPIEEMSLPNGLSATTIKAAATQATQKAPTFSEAFPTPFALPQLTTPKLSKRPTPKDNVLRWEFPNVKGSKRGGYTTQTLAVADWLTYGGDPRHDSLSPLEKRQERDRALSSSRPSGTAKSVDALAAELEKQEEALFQRAYSSFAPAYDNSRSLVDASVKSMVWWHKAGSRQFNARFAGEYSLGVDIPPANLDRDAVTSKDEDAAFAKAVEEYSEPDQLAEAEIDLTDVDNVLERIAHLLETLASYQWIRNSTLPSSAASRTPISPAPNVSGKSGKPGEPSDDEVEVYEQARREIAYLILRLPPYAVAKIDGDQLQELGVSKYITFEASNSRGQLEEDQVARYAKYAAAATAASVASLTRSSAITNPHYSSSSRTPAIGQSANTRYGASGGYGSGRTPLAATSQQRPGTAQNSYGTPTAPPRSQYSQPGQYARAGAPQQSYGQTNPQSYRQPGNYSNYAPSYNQSTQQTQPRGGIYQPAMQQRSQRNANNAVAYQTTQGSPAMSAKTGPTAISTGQQFAQQLQQPGSGHGTPVNHTSPAHTPVNGLQQARAPPPMTGTPQPAQMQNSAASP